MDAQAQSWGGLDPQDRRALERYVTSTLGHCFRLAIVETAAPWQRKQIVEGLRPLLQGQPLLEVALHELPGENLWQELLARLSLEPIDAAPGAPKPPGEGLLVLWGLEEAGARTEVLMQMLNVQRDLFVRDVRVPWVLFVHPGLSTRLQARAPDFCDVAILWVRAEGGDLGFVAVGPGTGAIGAIGATGAMISPLESGDNSWTLLLQAEQALNRRRLDEARDLLARFVLAGRASEEEKLMESVLQGLLDWRLGDTASARMRLQQAIGKTERTGGAFLRGMAAHYLGAMEDSQGNYAVARRLLGESLRCFEQVEDPTGRAATLYELARLEAQQGKYDEARRLYQEALQIYTEIGQKRNHAISLTGLATVELRLGNHGEARKLLKDVLPIFDEVGDRHGRATAVQLLASVADAHGDSAEARRLLLDALQVRAELGDRMGHAAGLCELALLEFREGNMKDARRHLLESAKIFDEVGDRHGHAITHLELGQLEVASGRLQEGRTMLREAAATLAELHAAEAPEAARILARIESPTDAILDHADRRPQ